MQVIKAKSILQKVGGHSNQWFGIDYNINLYKGCSHGCIYCDSRSSCYQIDHFDEVRIKDNEIAILNKELQSKKKKGVVGIGAMSDTYNPFEKNLEITRQALKLLQFYHFGVSIDTKSDLVVRDIDILKQMKNVIIKFTITTADDELCKKIEPHVCASSARFKAMKALSDNGIFTGVLFTPILPFITDQEDNIRNVIRLAYEHGAKFIYSMFGVTLRENQRDYYYSQLDQLFPGLKEKYQQVFGNNYMCGIRNYSHLKQVFIWECQKYGLLYKMEDIITAYKLENEQIQLTFDL